MATYYGGSGNDTATGTSDNDSLSGNGGNDSLFGGMGDDTLSGDAGYDTLYGDAGNDQITGGDDLGDTLYGGDGNDTIYAGNSSGDYSFGGAGDDLIYDGDGSDQARGDQGNDKIFGGLGNDTDVAGTGDDQVYGGAGNDSVAGDDGRDSIYGGTDNDTVQGGQGSDVLDGGDGADLIRGDIRTFGPAAYPSGPSLTPTSFSFTNSSTLTVKLYWIDFSGTPQLYATLAPGQGLYGSSYAEHNWMVTDAATGDYLSIYVGGVNQSISFTEDFADTITGGAGVDTIYGDYGHDSIDAGSENDLVYGGSGNDTVAGGTGDDTVDLGAGDDAVGDWNAEAGNDLIYGGAGNDLLYGGADNDMLYGGSGNDTLSGGIGSDTIYGGSGNDAAILTEDHQSDLYDMGEEAGDRDALWFGNYTLTNGVSVTFTGTDAGTYGYAGGASGGFIGVEQIFGTEYGDTINAAADTDGVTVSGNGGADSITAGSGFDWIYAGSGDDTVFGGTSSDTLFGGDGGDLLSGDADNDLMVGEAGNDTLAGGAGEDTLFGGAGQDSLDGGAGNDLILLDDADNANDAAYGGAGNDMLLARSDYSGGSDSLFGGADRDTLFAGAGDYVAGGETGDDVDSLYLSGAPYFGTNVIFSASGTGTALDMGFTLNFTEIEAITTTEFDDRVDASADSGGMQINLDSGEDFALGGSGNDTIYGGADNDTLAGGAGADLFYGGAGLDVLDYSASSAGVSVNLSSGALSGGDATGDSIAGMDGIIGSAYDDTLTGSNGQSTAPADFFTTWISAGAGNDLVYGGGGDDSLMGDAGNDRLYGGTGDDSLVGGSGNDTLSGGAGNDTLTGGGGGDVFDFDRADGADRVTDFDLTLVDGHTTDRLDVSDLRNPDGSPLHWGDFTIGDDGQGNTLLTFPEGEAVVLVGVDPAGIGKFEAHRMGLPCFTAGTLIDTPGGRRRIEDLRAGDLVTTPGGAAAILWAGGRHVGAEELAALPALRPVMIRRGALGNDRPLVLSRQHAVLIAGPGGSPALVRAGQLAHLGKGGFRVQAGRRSVRYHHLLLARHGLVRANGAWAETLWPGPAGLAMLGTAAAEEIALALPRLGAARAAPGLLPFLYGPRVAPALTGRILRALAGLAPVPDESLPGAASPLPAHAAPHQMNKFPADPPQTAPFSRIAP